MLDYFPALRASYRAADAVQHRLARLLLDRKAGASVTVAGQGYLLAYEMDPVYTTGRRQAREVSASDVDYLRMGGRADYVATLRGGHTTFHGPGQLVLYPVVDLKALNLRVRDYVCTLEGAIIATLATFGVEGRRSPGNNGVWLDDTRKIASVGIHVRRNITNHGVSINVAMDPQWFSRIVACNLPDARLVSLADAGVAAAPTVSQVGNVLAAELGRIWNVGINRHSVEESKELLVSCA